VFDGSSPPSKYDVVAKRISDMKKSEEKCECIDDKTSLEYKKESKKSYSLFAKTNQHEKTKIEECKHVLELMGICFVNAKNEADPQCAAIAEYYKNTSVGVLSEDFDMLLYNAPALLKNFSFKGSEAIKIEKEIIFDNLLKEANNIRSEHQLAKLKKITRENFVDFFVLFGTDYSFDGKQCKITKVSPNQLFEIFVMVEFDKVEFIKCLKKMEIAIDSDFLEIWKKTSAIYLNPILIDPRTIKYVPTGINEPELLKFLESKQMDMKFVTEELAKIKQNYGVLKNIHDDEVNISQFKVYTGYQFNFHTRRWIEHQKGMQIFSKKYKKEIKNSNSHLKNKIVSAHKAMTIETNDDMLNSFFTARQNQNC
jgi:5'-3' exonuclease